MAIANGVFKKVSYAQEGSFGIVPSAAGVGLISNAVLGKVTYSALDNGAAVGTAIKNATTSGTFLVGQKIKIGNEVFTVDTVTTTAGTGKVATLSVTESAVAAAVSATATLLQSTTVAAFTAPTGIPSAPGTTSTANLTGDNNIALGTSVTGHYAIGQKFTIAGVSNTFTVTNTLENDTKTIEITFTPNLPNDVASGVALTLVGGLNSKYLRRISSTVDLSKETFTSTEITTSQQTASVRHGGKTVGGAINGEFSGSSYSDFYGSVLRKNFVAPSVVAALPAAAIITSSDETFKSATLTTAGSFSGLKVGQIITASGATSGWLFSTADSTGTVQTKHLVVTAYVSDTVIKVVIANTSDYITTNTILTGTSTASVTFVSPGKTSFVPTSSHTNDSYTIQHEYSDIGVFETFTGCRITQANIKAPASGIVTTDFTVMGRDMSTLGNALGTPSAASTTDVFSAAVGGIYINDAAESGLVTAFDIAINGNGSNAKTVGSDLTPDVFLGRVGVTGQISIFFENATIRDYFIRESEIYLLLILTSGDGSASTGASTFTIVMPKVKLNGATKDDSEKGLTMSAPYVAMLSTGKAGFTDTTIQMFDSTL